MLTKSQLLSSTKLLKQSHLKMPIKIIKALLLMSKICQKLIKTFENILASYLQLLAWPCPCQNDLKCLLLVKHLTRNLDLAELVDALFFSGADGDRSA